MKKAEVKKLESIANKLHSRLESFRLVAKTLDLSLKDTIYLLKADEQSRLKHFRSKKYTFIKFE